MQNGFTRAPRSAVACVEALEQRQLLSTTVAYGNSFDPPLSAPWGSAVQSASWSGWDEAEGIASIIEKDMVLTLSALPEHTMLRVVTGTVGDVFTNTQNYSVNVEIDTFSHSRGLSNGVHFETGILPEGWFEHDGDSLTVKWSSTGLTHQEDYMSASAIHVYAYHPTVSLSGGGAITEVSTTGTSFTVSRDTPDNYGTSSTGDDPVPDTEVGLELETGDPIVAGASEYTAVPTSVTLTGPAAATFSITPVDDQTPEWTERVPLAIKQSDADYLRASAFRAKAEIVDNDLKIEGPSSTLWVNNDDDNSNDTPDRDEPTVPTSDDDLKEMTLTVPQDARQGATVTLSASWSVASRVRVWGPDGAQLLGPVVLPPGVSGPQELRTSKTWTYGSSGSAGQPPGTVKVEAIAGSGSVGDIVFALADSDAAATPTPQAPTAVAATTQGGTAEGLQIDWTGGGVNNVQGRKAGKVIVGQQVMVRAVPLGPAAAAQVAYQWTVGGKRVADYKTGVGKGEVIPLDGDKLKAQDVTFYFVDGDFAGADRDVTVAVGGRTATTRFTVFRPKATIQATAQSAPGINGTDTQLFAVMKFDRQNFQVPGGFAGDTSYSQLVLSGDVRRHLPPTGWQRFRESPGLDGSVDYPSGPPHDAPGSTSDSPSIPLDTPGIDKVYGVVKFGMYLMFKPTVQGQTTIPVPLRLLKWGFVAGAAKDNNGVWQKDNGSKFDPAAPTDIDTTDFPVWTHNNNDDVRANIWDPAGAPPAL